MQAWKTDVKTNIMMISTKQPIHIRNSFVGKIFRKG